jgi:hypothetical protein
LSQEVKEERGSTQIAEEGIFQATESASAKALRQECTRNVAATENR